MRNEPETLLAAAVAVTDTRAVTARSMPASARAWPGELELWMVCSTMRAALASRKACWSSRNTDLEDGLSF